MPEGIIASYNDCLFGWDGRIRTYDLLVQSEAPYRLATSQ
jgi:hypothetical protein